MKRIMKAHRSMHCAALFLGLTLSVACAQDFTLDWFALAGGGGASAGGAYALTGGVDPLAEAQLTGGSFTVQGGLCLMQTPTAACRLSIERSGPTLVISWPADCGDCVLEAATNLNAAPERNVWTQVMSSTNGGTFLTPAEGPSRFFRLRLLSNP